jgi:dihydroorotate dehydrogenase electron transfer subunit
MLAAIARLAAGRGWKASLSAEQWMACGVGACMGCVLPRPAAADGSGQGFLRACADGPVFELGDIDWEKA